MSGRYRRGCASTLALMVGVLVSLLAHAQPAPATGRGERPASGAHTAPFDPSTAAFFEPGAPGGLLVEPHRPPIGRVSESPASANLRTYRTRHYTLHTDTDVEYAAHLADYLDAYHEALSRHLHALFDVHVDMPRTSIVLFERQSSYQSFAAIHAPQLTNNGGYYDGGTRTIVTYRFNNSMQLYFHEIIHAVMGELFGDHFFFRYTRAQWPIWFDEGLAEYLGSFEIEDRVLRIGVVNPAKVAYLVNALSTNTLIDLRSLLVAPPEHFSGADMNIYYAASWGLLAYLASHPEHRTQLPLFLTRLREGESGLAAFEAAFGSDFDGMDAAWRKWLRSLAGADPGAHALFDGRTIDDWTIHEGGVWRVRGGEIVAVGDDNYNYLIKSDMPREEFLLRLEVRVDGGTVGLILGNNFHGEYPYYYLIDLSAQRVGIRRSYSPTRIETLHSLDISLDSGRWTDVEVSVKNARLELRLNGKTVVDLPEDRDQYSLFGLYLYRGRARFRDIALAPKEPTPREPAPRAVFPAAARTPSPP